MDIALGNSDHGHIQLLQSFGAKTGHCVVDNSALVIQHQWKVFKRRFSAVDSTYRSNLSDSISYHDRVEFSPTKHDVRRKDSNSVVLEEQCFATTKDKDLHYDAEEHHQTTPHISAYNENGNQLEKDQFVIEAPKFDPEKLIELKQSVAERVKSSVSMILKIYFNHSHSIHHFLNIIYFQFQQEINTLSYLHALCSRSHNVLFVCILSYFKTVIIQRNSHVFSIIHSPVKVMQI